MNEATPIIDIADQLEAIAKDIELLQATAVLRIAERLAEAHQLFLYKRDEGGFEGWVKTRLSMSRTTAYNLLTVHDRFGESVQQLDTLPRAVLYLLAAPSTPDGVREEAIERVEAGERITKAEAEAMVAKAKQQTVDELREHVLELERAESQRIKTAVEAVEAKYADIKADRKALQAELKQIRKNVFEDPDTLDQALCEMLGVKKLQPKHWKAVAEATGRQIVIGKAVYEPYTNEERAESDERVRQTSAITRALETLAAAPSPQAFRSMVFESQLELHRQVAGNVAAWLSEYAALLEREEK